VGAAAYGCADRVRWHMKKRRTYNPNGCIGCGGPCTKPCVDNTGKPYLGCPNCRFLTLEEMGLEPTPKRSNG
jgi:hypothetical protein